MKIKEIIKETGRYEQIMEFLIKELTSNASYAVRPFYKDYEIVKEISSADIHKGIKWFMYLIKKQEEEITEQYYDDKLWALERRVSDYLDTLLHNYANAISHRHEGSKSDMETIRTLQVLYDVINFFMYDFTFEIDDERILEIPVAWYSDERYNEKKCSYENEEEDFATVVDRFVSALPR